MARPPRDRTSKTLNQILRLIHKDVNAIQSVASGREPRWKQLTKESSDKLTKYAATLHDILKVKDKDIKAAKKDLEKLSTQELVELYAKTEKKEEGK